jgi:hypothetical protein
LEIYKLVVKFIQYLKKKRQNILYFFKKNAKITLGFLSICKKKIIFLIYFLGFVRKKNLFFFVIKLPKIGLKGVCQPHP